MLSGAMKARHFRRWLGGLALVLGLAACGGGTSQREPFQPQRMFVFGDESSLLLPDGRKYSVNVLNDAGAIDCTLQPLWVQAVANLYSFVFAGCNPAGVAVPQATMRAVLGAKIDGIAAQIDIQVAAGGYTGADLSTVLVGANDVIELYQAYPGRSEADLIEDARQRGTRLGQQINRLVGLGAKVIVATVPDMGFSPYAVAQKTLFTDTDRAALLSRLTAALNGRLRIEIINDGRYIGLVLVDEMVQAMARAPLNFGVTQPSAVLCTVALPNCSSATLVTDGASLNFLWADDRRMAFGGHQQIGLLARARATGNPF